MKKSMKDGKKCPPGMKGKGKKDRLHGKLSSMSMKGYKAKK